MSKLHHHGWPKRLWNYLHNGDVKALKFQIKTSFACVFLCTAFFTGAQASEGLWLPEQQPDWPTQPHASAVLKVGGCTGTFVSPDGLVLTNHHCILDLLQYRSTLENNYLTMGFLAINRNLELLAPPDFIVAQTLQRIDVTSQVLQGVNERITGSARFNLIANNRNDILRRCEDGINISCRVVEHYDGLGYLLVRDQNFPQIKLVWAPPANVGHFGGLEDNWQWPRHSADLALLRVYNADGSAYEPSHWLPLSPAAPADGEPVYVAGFPGTTQRYRLLQEADMAFAEFYPNLVLYSERWMAIIETAMQNNPGIALRYIPNLVRQGNRLQNIIGMLGAVEKYDARSLLLEQEQELRDWVAATPDNERFTTAIAQTESALEFRQTTLQRQLWWNFFQELQLPLVAQRLYRLAEESGRAEERRTRGFQAQQVPAIRSQLISQVRQFAPEVEIKLLVELLVLYQELPETQRIPFIETFFELNNSSSPETITARVEEIYANSKLGDPAVVETLMSTSLSDFRRYNDPWIQFAVNSAEQRLQWDLQERELRGLEQQGRSVLMDAFRRQARSQGKRLPDNANRTFRLSAGYVAAEQEPSALQNEPSAAEQEPSALQNEPSAAEQEPSALENEPSAAEQELSALEKEPSALENEPSEHHKAPPARTTLQSLLAIAGTEERYELPFNMHAAVAVHGAGCLAESAEQLTLNFLSTADGTGGSSGSPTVNNRGELIGLVFDSTTDAILSDWHFDDSRHRMIHADVRYILWLLRYVYQAHELMAELGFKEDENGCSLNDQPIIPRPARAGDFHQDPAE
ncbi:Peptidase S46 [Idiomarina sp. A28L]|uniref:S46 family peptidase n=1 Tax=Idiomarina sp. A28L TaxID=1036674 RepID=UPI0002138697|nr:S46 family peptidase [Idiomarina sp. A28L]EGN74205.1 Peptidase S46 [Idiomarina sp. A28L]